MCEVQREQTRPRCPGRQHGTEEESFKKRIEEKKRVYIVCACVSVCKYIYFGRSLEFRT